MDRPMARRVERLAVRMHDVMEKLEVEAVSLARLEEGERYAEARRTCLICGSSDKCLNWLDGGPRLDRRPTFCPNLPLFDACRKRGTGV